MQQIDQTIELGEAVFRATYGDPDGRILEVVVTDEGIIMDAYEDGGTTHVGTVGKMADEWFEYVEGSGS